MAKFRVGQLVRLRHPLQESIRYWCARSNYDSRQLIFRLDHVDNRPRAREDPTVFWFCVFVRRNAGHTGTFPYVYLRESTLEPVSNLFDVEEI